MPIGGTAGHGVGHWGINMSDKLGEATARLNASVDKTFESMNQVFVDMNSVFVEIDNVFDEVGKKFDVASLERGVEVKSSDGQTTYKYSAKKTAGVTVMERFRGWFK